MNYQYRFLTERLQKVMEYFPVVVLTGARQVGKSTLLTHLLSGTHEIIVFDPVLDVENARSEPELFFQNHPGPVVLDEIQYAPELIPVIKRLVDQGRDPGCFVLTGSQQWGVLRTISESLAGRAVLLGLMGYHLPEMAGSGRMTRWIEQYLQEGADAGLPVNQQHLQSILNDHLYRGQLPGVQELPLDMVPLYLDSYLRTYVERDARLMAEISDLQQFGRFYRLCAALSAQEVNFSQLGRDIGVSPQTSKRWLDILQQTFQWIEIPAFSGNTVKRISSRPKGYLSDTGLLCRSLFLSSHAAIPSHPQWGSIIETFIVGDILKTLSMLPFGVGVYHWRSHGGAEVDLVLEKDGRFYPIEIKSTSRPAKKDALGIHAFMDTYPRLDIARGLVVHLGEANFHLSDRVTAVSYQYL